MSKADPTGAMMKVEVKLPKPGDQLPFVVAENNGRILSYDESGQLRLDGRDEVFMYAIAELLGIPDELVTQTQHTVAPTEGGGE